MKVDKELEEFRDLMPVPDHWDEGFGLKAMIGGLFVGLIMTPASIYMGLVIGQGVGGAAQWVTTILFCEVARRSFTQLKRPEIYVLFYMAGATLGGGGLLWAQFLPQSESMRQFGLADKIPPWIAPTNPDILGMRWFFHPAWVVPIGLMILGAFIAAVDRFGLGYIMYRLTSDVEKLPFPMAPVSAAGVTALADAYGENDTWRWRVFSFGAMLGLAFATVYLALPAISGALLPEPISILPLPFKDLTSNTEALLPALPVMLSFDLAIVLFGMVIPFSAAVGGLIGSVVVMIANPILYHHGVLHSWQPGLNAITTIQANTLDFYFSFGLGLTMAIAVVGFYQVISSLRTRKRELDDAGAPTLNWKALFHPPEGRGDISIWIAVAIYFGSTLTQLGCAYWLLSWGHRYAPGLNSAVTWPLMAVLVFYGFIYTPILSYVSARMQGMISQGIGIPMVREATFILSGYKGTAIWFAPFPANDYGAQTGYFRVTELTGTKISSMIKAELFIFPVAVVMTLIFSQFIWSIAPVPSSAFPYAQQFWELTAFNSAILMSSTLPGGEHGAFFQAFNPAVIAAGLGIALALFAGLAFLSAPIFLVYGIIGGLGQSSPAAVMPQILGAVLGRYYFAKKFGKDWPQYRVVFLAGYGCGVGLLMMLALGVVFMSKAVFQARF